MFGTANQVEWAKSIREQKAAEMPDFGEGNPAAKAKDFILAIEDSKFWIDHRNLGGMVILRQIISKDGLRFKGFDMRATAHMDQTTGEITFSNMDPWAK